MSGKDTWTWVAVAAGVAAIVYFNYSGTAQATPLSIYPELAYTAQPSMATTPRQQAAAAVIPPTPYFSSVQSAEQSAIYAQCIGGNVCSPLLGDTQLGL